ncbi:hypothetical protein SAMD00023353_3800190 [Rosellinia necatrix]|uniref:Uncharacterized protein n=1 Tax=Rosellinia necatrix TaxID=77044 RepID=A0A1W2TME8_ROSNE|nr:hypothetical protein SAMD00023353_3800190 [Rosellinia necatrix]
MDKVNPSISNGSCWSNVNVALEDAYIPCGNVADGSSYACCHFGDNCLSSNACYHARFGITYLAGCTTQDFSGPACQNKGPFFNQSWVGLTRCDPDQTSWAGCPEKAGIVGSSPPTANCKCAKDTVLFQDRPMLENIASLPQSLGGTISWFPNHEPTSTTSKPITTSKTLPTASTGVTSTTDSSPTSSNSPAESSPPVSTTPPHATGLSTGAKAGIGVGSAFGAIVIGCLIAVAVIFQRRKTKGKDIPSPRLPTPTTQSGPTQPGAPESTFSVLGGFKAELPADDPPRTNTMASSSITAPPTPTPTPSPAQPPTPHQYQPYRPGAYHRHSNVSQLSSGTPGYSESLVSVPSPVTLGEPHRSAQPETIHELQ